MRFLAFLSVAALAHAAAVDAPHKGGQLNLAMAAEPKTLDPLKAADESSGIVRYLTGGVLIRLNRQTQGLEPELALSWNNRENGKRISFHLRPGLLFSDGSPFRAKDVCFTFSRLMDPALDSPFSDNFEIAKGKTICQPEGDYSVSLIFPVPIAAVERLFDDIPIQSSAAKTMESAVLGLPSSSPPAKPDRTWSCPAIPTIGEKTHTGSSFLIWTPFVWRSRGIATWNCFGFAKANFRSSTIWIRSYSIASRRKRPTRSATWVFRSLTPEQLWFNQVPTAPIPANKKAWFASREFRAAISQSILRDDLVRVVYRGHGSPAAGPISPANKQWWNSSLVASAANPAAALEHLQQEGVQMSGGVLRDKTGQPVEFSIITNGGNKTRERMAAMIQQDLKALGIRVTVTTLDFPSLIERITSTFNYEACLLGQINTDVDPNGQSHVWNSSSESHQWNPNQKTPATEWEAEMDRLMAIQASTPDPIKRKMAFDQVQRIVAEELPFIYLAHRHNLIAVSPALGNFKPVTLWPQTLWNADRIYLRP